MNAQSNFEQFGGTRHSGEVKFAAGMINVSPRVPCALGSSKYPEYEFRSIESGLEANIVLLFSCGDLILCLISIDALYVGARFVRTIEERLGLSSGEVLVFASHTHQAPMLDHSKPLLGLVDDRHFDFVVSSVVNRCKDLLSSDPVDGFIEEFPFSWLDHSVNRRLNLQGKVVMAPNFLGPRDETLRGFVVLDSAGATLAVVWNYSCHPVGFYDPRAVSSHFPGVARSVLRNAFGDETLPVLFIQGFSADTKPSATAAPSTPLDGLRMLLRGPMFYLMSKRKYSRWSGSLAVAVSSVAQRAAEGSGKFVKSIHTESLSFDRGCFVIPVAECETVRMSAVRIRGDSLNLVIFGVSAEVPVELCAELDSIFDDCSSLILGGCFDDTYGYLQTRKMLREGGYEVDGFLPFFSLDAVVPHGDELLTQSAEYLSRLTEL